MTPLDIFQRLEEIIGIDGSPRRLGTVIETELRDYFGVPPVQAAEKAEQMEGKVRQLISQSNSNSDSTGSYVVLSMSSINDRVVQGSCYIEPDEPVTTTVLKRRRLHIDPLLDHIQNLTFHQFETFGACVLKELGSKNPQVTPHSDDQGIDFYGLLSLGQNADLPFPFGKLAHDVKMRFVGQAKHYPNTPIGPNLIRELIGAITLARYKIFTTGNPFNDLELHPFNPLVTMFFTTGRFTRGALELAEEAGIIARNGEQLAVFLADRGVGIEETNGQTRFNSQKFFDWLML